MSTIDFQMTVNGHVVSATPRFIKWMQNVTVLRDGIPIASKPYSLNTKDDAGVIAMHLLAYTVTKYTEDYFPSAHAAIDGHIIGRIDVAKVNGEFYLVYVSARSGVKEQVTLFHDGKNKEVCSISEMNKLTKNVSQPAIRMDTPAHDSVESSFSAYMQASHVPVGTRVNV